MEFNRNVVIPKIHLPIIAITPEAEEDDDHNYLNLAEALTDIEDLDMELENCKISKNRKKVKTKLMIKIAKETDYVTDIEDYECSDNEPESIIIKHSNPVEIPEIDMPLSCFEESFKTNSKKVNGGKRKLYSQASTTKSPCDAIKLSNYIDDILTDVEDFGECNDDLFDDKINYSDLDINYEFNEFTDQINDKSTLLKSDKCVDTAYPDDSESDTNVNNKVSIYLTTENNTISCYTDVETLSADNTGSISKRKKSKKPRKRRPKGSLRNKGGVTDIEDVELAENDAKKYSSTPALIQYSDLNIKRTRKDKFLESDSDDDLNIGKKTLSRSKSDVLNIFIDNTGLTDMENFEDHTGLSDVDYNYDDNKLFDAFNMMTESCGNINEKFVCKNSSSMKECKYNQNTDTEDYESENDIHHDNINTFCLNDIDIKFERREAKYNKNVKETTLAIPESTYNNLTDLDSICSSDEDIDNTHISLAIIHASKKEEFETDVEVFSSDERESNELSYANYDILLPMSYRKMIVFKENGSAKPSVTVMPISRSYTVGLSSHTKYDSDTESETHSDYNDYLVVSDPRRCPTPDILVNENDFIINRDSVKLDSFNQPVHIKEHDILTDTEDVYLNETKRITRKSKKTLVKQQLYVEQEQDCSKTDTEDITSDIEIANNEIQFFNPRSVAPSEILTDIENLDHSDDDEDLEERYIIDDQPCTPQHLRDLCGDFIISKEGTSPFSHQDKLAVNQKFIKTTMTACSPLYTDTEDIISSNDDEILSCEKEFVIPTSLCNELDDVSRSKVYNHNTKKINYETAEELLYLKGGGVIEATTDVEEIHMSDMYDEAVEVTENFSYNCKIVYELKNELLVNLEEDTADCMKEIVEEKITEGAKQGATIPTEEIIKVEDEDNNQTDQQADLTYESALLTGVNRSSLNYSKVPKNIISYNEIDLMLDKMLLEVEQHHILYETDLDGDEEPQCINEIELVPSGDALIEIPISRSQLPKVYETVTEIEISKPELDDCFSMIYFNNSKESKLKEENEYDLMPFGTTEVDLVPSLDNIGQHTDRSERMLEDLHLKWSESHPEDDDFYYEPIETRNLTSSMKNSTLEGMTAEGDIWWEGTYRNLSIVPEEDEDYNSYSESLCSTGSNIFSEGADRPNTHRNQTKLKIDTIESNNPQKQFLLEPSDIVKTEKNNNSEFVLHRLLIRTPKPNTNNPFVAPSEKFCEIDTSMHLFPSRSYPTVDEYKLDEDNSSDSSSIRVSPISILEVPPAFHEYNKISNAFCDWLSVNEDNMGGYPATFFNKKLSDEAMILEDNNENNSKMYDVPFSADNDINNFLSQNFKSKAEVDNINVIQDSITKEKKNQEKSSTVLNIENDTISNDNQYKTILPGQKSKKGGYLQKMLTKTSKSFDISQEQNDDLKKTKKVNYSSSKRRKSLPQRALDFIKSNKVQGTKQDDDTVKVDDLEDIINLTAQEIVDDIITKSESIVSNYENKTHVKRRTLKQLQVSSSEDFSMILHNSIDDIEKEILSNDSGKMRKLSIVDDLVNDSSHALLSNCKYSFDYDDDLILYEEVKDPKQCNLFKKCAKMVSHSSNKCDDKMDILKYDNIETNINNDKEIRTVESNMSENNQIYNIFDQENMVQSDDTRMDYTNYSHPHKVNFYSNYSRKNINKKDHELIISDVNTIKSEYKCLDNNIRVVQQQMTPILDYMADFDILNKTSIIDPAITLEPCGIIPELFPKSIHEILVTDLDDVKPVYIGMLNDNSLSSGDDYFSKNVVLNTDQNSIIVESQDNSLEYNFFKEYDDLFENNSMEQNTTHLTEPAILQQFSQEEGTSTKEKSCYQQLTLSSIPSPLTPKPKPRSTKLTESQLDIKTASQLVEIESVNVESELVSRETDLETSATETYSDKKKFWESIGKEASQDVKFIKRMSVHEESFIEKDITASKRFSVQEISMHPPTPKPRSGVKTEIKEQSEEVQDVEKINDIEEVPSESVNIPQSITNYEACEKIPMIPVTEYHSSFKDPSITTTKPLDVVKEKIVESSLEKEASVDSDVEYSGQFNVSSGYDNTGYISDSGDVEHYISDSEIEDRVPQIRERQMSVFQPRSAARKSLYERSASLPTEDLYEVSAHSIMLRKQYYEEQIKKEMVEDELMTEIEEEDISQSQEHKTLDVITIEEEPSGIKSLPEPSHEDNYNVFKKSKDEIENKLDIMYKAEKKDEALILDEADTSIIGVIKPENRISEVEKIKQINISIPEYVETAENIQAISQSFIDAERALSEVDSKENSYDNVSINNKLDSITKPSDSMEVHVDKSELEDSEKITDLDTTDMDARSLDSTELSPKTIFNSDVIPEIILESKKTIIEQISPLKESIENIQATIWEVPIQTQTQFDEKTVDLLVEKPTCHEREDDISISTREESDLGSEIHQDHSESYSSDRIKTESHDIEKLILESLHHQKISPEEAQIIANELIADIEAEIERRNSASSEVIEPPAPEYAKNQISEYLQHLADIKGLDSREVELVQSVLARKHRELAKLSREDTQASSMEITDEELRYSGTDYSPSGSRIDILEEQIDQLKAEKVIDIDYKSMEIASTERISGHLESVEIVTTQKSPVHTKNVIMEEDESVIEVSVEEKIPVNAVVISSTEECDIKSDDIVPIKAETISFDSEIAKENIKDKTLVTAAATSSVDEISAICVEGKASITAPTISTVVETSKTNIDDTIPYIISTDIHKTLPLEKPESTVTENIIDTSLSKLEKAKHESTLSKVDVEGYSQKELIQDEQKLSYESGISSLKLTEAYTEKSISEHHSSIDKNESTSESYSKVLTESLIKQIGDTTASEIGTEIIVEKDDKTDYNTTQIIYESGKLVTEITSSEKIISEIQLEGNEIHDYITTEIQDQKTDHQVVRTESTSEIISESVKKIIFDETTSESKIIDGDKITSDIEVSLREKKREHDTSSSSSNKKTHRKSGLDIDAYSSSGESYYHSFEIDSAKSRPTSSDVEVLIAAGSSEYESALASQETSNSKSHLTSTEYHTAVSSQSSKESMKSLDSESSGNLASVEVSEASETLVPSEFELNGEMPLDEKSRSDYLIHRQTTDESELELDTHESPDTSEEDIIQDTATADMTSKMKRSHEMNFPSESSKSSKLDYKGSDEKLGTSLDEGSVLSVSLSSTSSLAAVRTVIENLEGEKYSQSFGSVGSLDEATVKSEMAESYPPSPPLVTSNVATITPEDNTAYDVVTLITTNIEREGIQSASTQVTSTVKKDEQMSEKTKQTDITVDIKKKSHRRNESTSNFIPKILTTKNNIVEIADDVMELQETIDDSSETKQEILSKIAQSSITEMKKHTKESIIDKRNLDKRDSHTKSSSTSSEKSSFEEAEAEAAFNMVAHISPVHKIKQICPILEDENAEKHELEVKERAQKEIEERKAQIEANAGFIPDIKVTQHLTPLDREGFRYPDLEIEEKDEESQKSAPQTPASISSKSSDSTDQGREYILEDTGMSVIEESEGSQSVDDKAVESKSEVATVVEKTICETDKETESPNSDSFELVEKPDLMDEFVVIEEVAKEAQEMDMEGQSLSIAKYKYVKKHDDEVEDYLVKTAPAPSNKMTNIQYYPEAIRHEDVGFEFDDSPPQGDGKDKQKAEYVQDFDKELEENKKWIEQQFLGDQASMIAAGFGYEMDFERGPLEDIKEEDAGDFDSSRIGSLSSHKESGGSLGSVKDSYSSTPEYDVLAGRKYFTKSGEHDDISMSSLQEFENLEKAMSLENRRFHQGSHDSSSNGSFKNRLNGRTGQGDDVSVNSLKEFEGLEMACIAAHKTELKVKEEEAILSQIDECQESITSESESCETLSGTDKKQVPDSDEEDYEKRMFEIDEIIRQAQTNVEHFIDFKEGERTESIGRGDSIEEVSRVPELDLDLPLKRAVTQPPTVVTDVMINSTDSLDIKVDKPPRYNSSDSLDMDQKTAADLMTDSTDSIECNIRKSAHGTLSTDSIEAKVVESDSLDLGIITARSIQSDSIDEDGSRIGIYDQSTSSTGKDYSSSVRDDAIIVSLEPKCTDVEYLLESTDSIASTSTGTYAYQSETESVYSGTCTSGGSNTMMSSTDTIDHTMTTSVDVMADAATSARKIWFDEDTPGAGAFFRTEFTDESAQPHITEFIEQDNDSSIYSHTIKRTVTMPPEVVKVSFKGDDAEERLKQYIDSIGHEDVVEETEEIDADGNVHVKRIVKKTFVIKEEPSATGEDTSRSGIISRTVTDDKGAKTIFTQAFDIESLDNIISQKAKEADTSKQGVDENKDITSEKDIKKEGQSSSQHEQPSSNTGQQDLSQDIKDILKSLDEDSYK